MATGGVGSVGGWINGGRVHPYQLAYADPKVVAEIWADDVDTWVAPAHLRVARPVEGGYIFNGRWQFSPAPTTATGFSLGAMLGDADGKPTAPPQMMQHDPCPGTTKSLRTLGWSVFGAPGPRTSS